MTEDTPGEPDPLAKAIFLGPGPAPAHLAAVARPYVERAKLKLKNFRVDMEDIQHRVILDMKDGLVDPEDAKLIFLDTGDVVSLPLVKRYCDAKEYELVSRWMMTNLAYARTSWLTERNRLAIERMIAGGEAALAAALLRKYLRKLREHTQNRWRGAGERIPQDFSKDAGARIEARKARELRDLPGNLEIAELEMAEIETCLAECGSREDHRAIEKFRDEIARVRKRFNLVRMRL